MDSDRIKGAAQQVKGTLKEAAGKITGDTKLQAEGQAEQLTGKAQNAFGGLKDAARDVAADADRAESRDRRGDLDR
ncbi:CsbD family protein [Rubellimicrobium arenae]|uniref:CsbD family protein n=1 Tax=Rubellimicrobium arenae TaxID=2817372 RepID=UPI001B3169A6|nr:CsbD family protein [Rubellimicrobium arenae]